MLLDKLQEVEMNKKKVVAVSNRTFQKLYKIILLLIMLVSLYLIFHLPDTKNAKSILKYNSKYIKLLDNATCNINFHHFLRYSHDGARDDIS